MAGSFLVCVTMIIGQVQTSRVWKIDNKTNRNDGFLAFVQGAASVDKDMHKVQQCLTHFEKGHELHLQFSRLMIGSSQSFVC